MSGLTDRDGGGAHTDRGSSQHLTVGQTTPRAGQGQGSLIRQNIGENK